MFEFRRPGEIPQFSVPPVIPVEPLRPPGDPYSETFIPWAPPDRFPAEADEDPVYLALGELLDTLDIVTVPEHYGVLPADEEEPLSHPLADYNDETPGEVPVHPDDIEPAADDAWGGDFGPAAADDARGGDFGPAAADDARGGDFGPAAADDAWGSDFGARGTSDVPAAAKSRLRGTRSGSEARSAPSRAEGRRSAPSRAQGLRSAPSQAQVRDAMDGPSSHVSDRAKPIREQSIVDRSVTREVSTATLDTDLPAAENPQIFDLQRIVEREKLRAEGLEVESRLERGYPRVLPGSTRADEVRIEHHGTALLQVATEAHGQVATRGLSLWFPAHTVHARNSTAVVVGNNCELTQKEHVHIRQAVVSQDDALRSPKVKAILARARHGEDNSRVVRDLQTTLRNLVHPPTETGPTRAEQKVRADCTTNIYQAESVQIGNDATTQLDSHYVVERTTIPAGALLAEEANEDLARRYVEIAADPTGDASVLADFLCDLVGSAQNATDDNVLGYADGLPRQRATVLGLFGMTAVNRATSIMIGVGNTLHTELDLTTAPMRPDQAIAKALTDHQASRPPEPSPAEPPAAPLHPWPASGPEPPAAPHHPWPASDPEPPAAPRHPWLTSDPPRPHVNPADVGAKPTPTPWYLWTKPVDDDPTDLSPGGMSL